MAEHDIGALPVVDEHGQLVGILSEADLLHRVEIGTEKHRPWLLESVTGATTPAEEFAKSHGKTVAELMTTEVISAAEDTSLAEIATLFERNRIKRVPIVSDGKLVGIVSRGNVIQAHASEGRPAKWAATQTGKSAKNCFRSWHSKIEPASAAATSPSRAAACICGD